VFDSGLGGLTAVRALDALLPGEELVFFGDTARLPYGTRSHGTIRKYLRQDIAFLRTFDIKMLVVACGTASTACLPALCAEYPFPLLGVVEPSAAAAAAATRNKRVGLLATLATVASGVYETTVNAIDPDVTVIPQACPLLVPLVENGRGQKGDAVAEIIVREYLQPLIEAEADTLILGCTHYPLLSGLIRDILGDGVTLIDSGEAVAQAAAALNSDLKTQASEFAPKAPKRRYFVSDYPEGYALNAALFLGRPLDGPLQKVDIEGYA